MRRASGTPRPVRARVMLLTLLAVSALAGCASWRAPVDEAVATRSPYIQRAEFEVMRLRNPSDVAVIRVVPETVLWKAQGQAWSFNKQQVAWIEPPAPPVTTRPVAAVAPIAQAVIVPPPLPVKPPEVSETVHFAFNKAVLSPEARRALDALPISGVRSVKVTAYTDSVGTDAYNDRLSERRAKVVADYLTTHGMAANKIETKALGKRDPVANNQTEEGRAENRRAVVVVTVQMQGS